MIKAIFFDVHGTIIDKSKEKNKGLTIARGNIVAFLNKNGFDVTDSRYHEVWVQNLKKYRQEWEELNEVDFYDWYGGILSDLGIDRYDKEFIDKMSDEWISGFFSTTVEIPPAKEILTKLKKDYLLGVISNSLGKNTLADLTITNFIDLFDTIVVSSDVGKRKPHPLIFTHALKQLNVGPEEAIFVGNETYEDIYGANQVGIKSILITNKDSLEYLSKGDKSELMTKPETDDNEPYAIIDNMGRLPEVLKEKDL